MHFTVICSKGGVELKRYPINAPDSIAAPGSFDQKKVELEAYTILSSEGRAAPPFTDIKVRVIPKR